MKPIKTTLALLTMPLILSCSSEVLTLQKPAEAMSDTVAKVSTHPVPFSVTVSDGSNTATRATLTAEKHYAFSAADMLYVKGTGDNEDKVFGVLGLSSKDIGKTSDVVFDGELNVADGFTPTDDMPLTAVLVGRDDMLYTFGEGVYQDMVLSYAYPQANAFTTTLAKAVERYSHMTAESTYGERQFQLTQNTCFLNISVTLNDGTNEGEILDAYVFTDSDLTDVRNGKVTTVKEGDDIKAKFVAAFPGGTTLNGAVIGLVPRSEISFGGTTTLVANKIYNVNKTFDRVPGSAAYTYSTLIRSNPDNDILPAENPLTIDGDGTATYSSSNTAVAQVVESGENAGMVTIVGPGDATITATIADGVNYTYADNNTASYTLTVKDPVALANVEADKHIGWVIGSDGYAYVTTTGVTANSPESDPIAMIGYIGSAGSADASSTTYRGLGVALTDVSLGESTSAVWANTQGVCTTSLVTEFPNAKTTINGIAMTPTLAACTTHTPQAAILTQAYNVSLPSEGCSDWFLPAVGQWYKVFEACGVSTGGWTEFGFCPDSAAGYAKLQELMKNVGTGFSDNYWTSTEYNARNAWYVGFNSESGVKMDINYKTNTFGSVFNVRPFIAF
jgi:hypothetical protein